MSEAYFEGNAASAFHHHQDYDDSMMMQNHQQRFLGGSGDGPQPYYAVLFPSVAVIVGIIVHYCLGRFLHHKFPYTAAMFVLGTLLGAAILPAMSHDGQFYQSTKMWSYIDGHVLLLVFLPGVLFKDAFSMDVHLFKKAFGQCLTMAFPEVLIGMTLTACVLTYVFPYESPFIYSMLLGSILAATDPVAVAALLNEVGAPPRLKTHIAGESLLNDGAAIVFFNIFYKMDIYMNTNGKYGETFTWGSGFLYFLKLSVGSMLLGIALGIIQVFILWILKHRYNAEENIVQVMSTAGMAYFSFYLGEAVLGMSGVITVVFCGFITKAFGEPMINDMIAMEKFWDLLEHILNTVLFTLGGVIWGTVAAGYRDENIGSVSVNREEYIGITDVGVRDENNGSNFDYKHFRPDGKAWGYLLLLYVFVLLIRAILITVFYPLVSRIGLKSNWQESLFMSWGGLRGAVGIALAILIENQWRNIPAEYIRAVHKDEEIQELLDSLSESESLFVAQWYAHLWFFFAGGISALTLVINGTTAGPLLKMLGIASPTKIRESIVKQFQKSMEVNSMENVLLLLGNPHFAEYVSFASVRNHIPYLADITEDELLVAIRRNKANQCHKSGYRAPNLSTFKHYYPGLEEKHPDYSLDTPDSYDAEDAADVEQSCNREEISEEPLREKETIEMRKVFMSLLQTSYKKQFEKGFIDTRSPVLVSKINSSVSRAGDGVAKGNPINDFEKSQSARTATEALSSKGRRASMAMKKHKQSGFYEYKKSECDVRHAVACISAHQDAQVDFKMEFGGKESAAFEIVIRESNYQIQLAREEIMVKNPADVRSIATHVLCGMILNEMVHRIESYVARGLLNSTEAEHLIHPIEGLMSDMEKCTGGCSSGKVIGDSTNRVSQDISMFDLSNAVMEVEETKKTKMEDGQNSVEESL